MGSGRRRIPKQLNHSPSTTRKESIDAHAAAMWQGGHLPAVGPTRMDEPLNISEKPVVC